MLLKASQFSVQYFLDLVIYAIFQFMLIIQKSEDSEQHNRTCLKSLAAWRAIVRRRLLSAFLHINVRLHNQCPTGGI
jgi:hypothetical protein